VAEAARDAIPGYWDRMGDQRVAFSSAVLCGPRGGIVLAPSMDEAIAFVNDYAPEHLEIMSADPYRWLGAIRNAGEILLGEHTPVSIGNFVLGPNAVLPTNAAARTRSPLSVFDYLKRISVGYVTRSGYDILAPKAKRFAEYEGFDAHANALSDMRAAAFARGRS
jgi:histidinol dehydrogenase